MRIDALATEPHFLDHLAPVWRSLTEPGTLWVDETLLPRAAALGLRHVVAGRPGLGWDPICVASFGDAKRARRALRPVVMMEHGAGQSYAGIESVTGSYVGSADRDGVVLVLVPNEVAAARHRQAHPEIPVEVIGSPHLDDLTTIDRPGDGVPCVSFHWDCQLVPETRSAWPEYVGQLDDLAAAHPGALGHAHPRLFAHTVDFYRAAGVEPVTEFADVVRRASVYVVDNSSTLFTFAALDRPVVVLNSRHYRRNVHHGGRFWDWADIGVACNEPAELVDAVELALADPADVAARRREIAAEIYPHRGDAAGRAVSAIEEVLCLTPRR